MVSALRSRQIRRLVFVLLLCFGLIALTKHLGGYVTNPDNGSLTTAFSKGDLEPKLIIYNRIPKTGSTSLVHLVQSLRQKNDVGMTMLNVSGNSFYLNRRNQILLVKNLIGRAYPRPLFLHGHFVHLNFAQFGISEKPVYINLIRDPLERMVSHYYFLRFGDDYRPNLIRRRMTNHTTQMQTFDECVRNGGVDCNPRDLWVQIPFFCGSAAYCRLPGNRLALQTAKRRVTEDYLLVGFTEAFEEFVLLLEQMLPRVFQGATNNLLQSIDDWHMRRTKNKQPISEMVRSLFRAHAVWKMEQEFYDFVRAEFWQTRNSLFQGVKLSKQSIMNTTMEKALRTSKQRFFFQRTKP